MTFYNKQGINFNSLSHLESIGLIQFNSLAEYQRTGLPKNVSLSYHEQFVLLELEKDSDNKLQIGHVVLTKIGQELAPICRSSPEQDFFAYICDKWKKEGYIKEEKAEQDGASDG